MKTPQLMIVDYGMGNLNSVSNALDVLNVPHCISRRPEDLARADGVILPGVGAFGAAMDNLREEGLLGPLTEQVLERGKPFLGICLGMQLLAETSEEKGHFAGLGWVPGRVVALPAGPEVRVPHVGWSETTIVRADRVGNGQAAANGSGSDRTGGLYEKVEQQACFYYDHSYCLECDPGLVTATFGHGPAAYVASIRRDNIFGVQFHPEKSQRNGLWLLRNFSNFVARREVACHA